MSAHPVLWTSPAPLWGRFGATVGGAAFAAEDQARPAVLRFASDEFMDQLLAMLAADPRRLGDVVARPETWRSPAGETPDLVERVPLARFARALARARKSEAAVPAVAPTTHERAGTENGVARTLPLKLYHAAHQRHYLVAANLVCGVAGFPDRAVAGGGEQVGFVVRRLLPKAGGDTSGLEEFAFVKDATGARWQRVAPAPGSADPAARLADGEELLPLFPLDFRDDAGRRRRLLAGVVPVGRREEYMSTRAERGAPAAGAGAAPSGGGAATAVSARKEQLKLEVTEPWKNLVRSAHAAVARIGDAGAGTVSDLVSKQADSARAANRQLQGQSWLLLLDFADYLSVHLPRVWEAVLAPAKRSQLVTEGERRLFDWLDGPGTAPGSGWPITGGTPAWPAGGAPPPPFAASLRDALAKARSTPGVREGLERAVGSFPSPAGPGIDWPNFLYLLAGVRQSSGGFTADGVHRSLGAVSVPTPDPGDVDAAAAGPSPGAVEGDAALLDKLVQLVVGAIDVAAPAAPAPPPPFALRLRDALASTPQDDAGWFVLRCAYVRADCGPLHPPVVSPPSQRFQLASFFDPDAPARPIRISLPLDTTPAGMRKYNKNTAFVISDVLCGQIQRAKGLGLGDLIRSVLPWPLHKPLDVGDLGPCKSNGATIGMICSLSIPIITICALILLLVIVILLDLIFRWLPWFILCFPIPGLRAKR